MTPERLGELARMALENEAFQQACERVRSEAVRKFEAAANDEELRYAQARIKAVQSIERALTDMVNVAKQPVMTGASPLA